MKGNKGERRKICVESIVYDDRKRVLPWLDAEFTLNA